MQPSYGYNRQNLILIQVISILIYAINAAYQRTKKPFLLSSQWLR